MKRVSILLFCMIVLSGSSALLCQDKTGQSASEKVLSSNPGFISINEITTGFGLGSTTVPYSKNFIGFTTINGYQMNKNFVAAVGTGIYFYNGGYLVPLFLDLRYGFLIGQFTPYVFADGGLMLNFSDNNLNKTMMNAGIGVRYSVSQNVAVNFGGGLMVQWGADSRDGFINIKAGVTLKF